MREQQRRDELQRLERLPKPEDGRPERTVISGTETGETILLKGLRFSGKVELLAEAERARLSQSASGERLGVAGLYALADEVTAMLQRQGHLLARAVLPPQDITEGVVTIQIVEGVLEGVTFNRGKDVRAKEDRLLAIAETRIDADSVTKGNLEAALLHMNDHPGVTARAKLTPGVTPNSSRLIVDVQQTPVFSATLSGDNAGSTSSGRPQVNGAVTLADVTGYGDLTRLFASVSEGQKFGSISLSAPLGASGFAINTTYSYLNYRNIDATGSALGLNGHAHFVSSGLDYSLIRSRDLNLHLTVDLDWKALVDDSVVGRLQDKRSLSSSIGINGDMRDAFLGGGLTGWSLGWTYGDLDLSREASALAADQASLKTQGQFHRLNASLARLQDLPGNFSLFARAYGQWANKNLDSSEDFALGGPYGVRGWPVGEGRGDLGVLGTVELRYDAPISAQYGALQFAGFLDAGHVWVNKNPGGLAALNACGCNDFSLASAGVSARWRRKELSLSATYAHGLGGNPGRSSLTGANAGGGTSSHQFWLSGAAKF